MKRMISVLLALCISVFMISGCSSGSNQKGSPGKTDLKQTATINGTDAAILANPGTGSKALGTLNNNEPVQILGKEGEWFRIRRIETVQSGWVHRKYLRLQ